MTGALKLNLYGTRPQPGWKIFAPAPGPHVDYVGTLPDLSQFADGSVEQIKAWQLLNKLEGDRHLLLMEECHRILRPGGIFIGTVPDMDVLCRLFVSLPDTGTRMAIAGLIYGDHSSPAQINHFGFNLDILPIPFVHAGFQPPVLRRPPELFADAPATMIDGIDVDLAFIAEK